MNHIINPIGIAYVADPETRARLTKVLPANRPL
jgi:hypothetical protein